MCIRDSLICLDPSTVPILHQELCSIKNYDPVGGIGRSVAVVRDKRIRFFRIHNLGGSIQIKGVISGVGIRGIVHILKTYNALFIVNDQVEIARQLDADGVHLGLSLIHILPSTVSWVTPARSEQSGQPLDNLPPMLWPSMSHI